MRHSQTAVLERGQTFAGSFETEPYEAPWASEARFFVQLLEPAPDAQVRLTTQISPDGITWLDAQEVPAVALDRELVSWPVTDFGAWLRVRGEVSGSAARLRIYLHCKE